jgi:monoamine oxidase
MVSLADDAQRAYFVGGSQRLSAGLAAALGERMLLGTPVRSVSQDADGVTVEADTGEWRARRAVVALPPLVTSAIEFAPALPAARQALVQRFPMGAATKVIALYERPFWREQGFSGEVASDRAAFGVTLDGTKPGGQAALVAFIEGAPARAWSTRPVDERHRAILDGLAGFFGPEALEPSAYVEQDWTVEPFTRGCSAGFATCGALSRFGPALREPVGRIHWAGTETAREWFGYMEGALESGERVAREILSR